jgi:transposase
MQKTKIIQEHFMRSQAEYQLILPLEVSLLIPKDDSVRLLSQIVEELDLKDLMLAYSPQGRNPAIPPRIMLKVLLYAYMNGEYSSRKIEKSCRRDINYMWLLQGHGAPDHNTISRFRTGRLSTCLETIFTQFIELLADYGEIPFENVFIDGTKIEANANKNSFVWRKVIERLDARIPGKVASLAEKVDSLLGTSYSCETGDSQKLLSTMAEHLAKEKEKRGIVFVSGKGRRKTELQRLTEEALELLEKEGRYTDYRRSFGDRNSFSKTDRDATFMHMKEDHMQNAQLKPGYNFQAAVENGYVLATGLCADRNDLSSLIPMMEHIHDGHPSRHMKNVVADAGYESEENYAYLDRHGYVAYIKPATYETQKKKGFKNRIGRRENMAYDAEADEYICAKGRHLRAIATKTVKNRKTGYPREVTVYECENCNRCGFAKQCKKSQNAKRIEVSKRFVTYREASQENITSDKGIILRVNRSIQAEGVFGMLKEDYGFRRFLTRGKANVYTECILMCFSYDINKLFNKFIGKGNREPLYEPMVA